MGPEVDEHSSMKFNGVILNQASSILRFEALQGRPLYCRDPEKRAEFASLAAREYEDDMALCQRGLAAWREMNGQN